MKKKKTKRGVGEAAILTAIVILITISLYLAPRLNITGFFIAEKGLLTYEEKINLKLNESTSFEFNISPDIEEFELVSIALSGRFIGDGNVEVHLEDAIGNDYLIFDKETIQKKAFEATGKFTEIEKAIKETTEKVKKKIKEKKEEVKEAAEKIKKEVKEQKKEKAAEKKEKKEKQVEEKSAEGTQSEETKESTKEAVAETGPDTSGKQEQVEETRTVSSDQTAETSTIQIDEGEEQTSGEETTDTSSDSQSSKELLPESTQEENTEREEATTTTEKEPVEESPEPTSDTAEETTDESEGEVSEEPETAKPETKTNETREAEESRTNKTKINETKKIKNTTTEVKRLSEKKNETKEVMHQIRNLTIEHKNITAAVSIYNVTSKNLTARKVTINTTPENMTELLKNVAIVENISVGNISTVNITTNVTVNIINVTEEINIIEFENVCLETCLLPKGLTGKQYKLVIRVDGNSTLELNKIKYTIKNITKKIPVKLAVLNADGETLNATVILHRNGESIVSTNSTESVQISPGIYDIEARIKDHVIDKIYFYSADLTKSIKKIASVDILSHIENITQGWAIKPEIDADSMDVMVTANGTRLYKCSIWKFNKRKCKQNFTFEQFIAPGETYTLNLSIEEFGFIETNEMVMNITNESVPIEKIYDDPSYEVVISSVQYDDDTKTLTVVFHHTAKNGKRIHIEFADNKTFDYLLDKEIAKKNENVTLKIFNWTSSEYFEIKVGDRTEIYGIGIPPEYTLSPAINDAENRTVEATVKILRNSVRFANTTTRGRINIQRGIYSIEIFPRNHTVKKIKLKGMRIAGRISRLLRLDNVPKEKLPRAVKAFAVDPTDITFEEATITLIASGNVLLKCQNWSFETRECRGSCFYDPSKNRKVCTSGWQRIANLTPGQEYNITLTPQDPAYAEYNSTYGAPYCGDSGISPCIANSSLLRSRDNIGGGSEPNYPNTIDTCNDGSWGTYQSDESVENITIASLNHSVFIKGDTINVTATVYCYDGSGDNVNFVYTNNTDSPAWKVMASVDPCPAAGLNTFSKTWKLDNIAGKHAVRVSIQWNGATTTTCGSGNYDDNDDVVFNVLADTKGPAINFVQPTPANDTVQNKNRVFINATVTDALSGIDACLLEWNGVNESMTKVGTGLSVYCHVNKTGLADGTYSYKVYANDSAGNWNVSETRIVTVDTTPPTITFVPPTPANGSILSQAWVFINITASENLSTALLEWNGINETMQGSGTNWYLNKTGLASGTYTYKVYGNDSSDNWGVSETRIVKINFPPQISLHYPLNNTQFNDTQTVTFNFTATDELSTTLSCSVYLDGILNQTNNSVQNGSVSEFTIANISYGEHNWFINCSDGELSTVSETRYFTIADTIPPSIYYNPNTEASGSYSKSWIFINITCSDQSRDSVILNWNGTNESFDNQAGDIFWENKTGLADGTYTFYAWCNDTYGNTNQTSQRTATLDTTPPTVNLESPANNTLEQNTNTITFNYNTTDAISDVANCSLYINGVLDETDTIITERTTQNFTKTLPNGYYNWSVSCYDAVGNKGTSETWYLNISVHPPVTTLIYPPDNYSSSSSSVTFNCSATDDAGLVNITLYIWNATGTYYTNTTTISGTSNSTTWTTTLTPDGTYTWNCLAYDVDGLGDWADADRTLTVDTTPPTITFVPPTPANASTISQAWVFINITASENLSTALLEWNGINETMQGSGTNWYLNKTGLAEGTYAYKVYGNDTVNNWNSSETRVITIDTTAPSITLYSPQNNTITANTTPTFNFTAVDNKDTNLTCELFINNLGYGIVSAPNNTPTTIIANDSLSDGTYYWYINCTDDATNTGKSAVWIINIDTSPPTWSNNKTEPSSPATYSPTQQYQFNITWSDAYDIGQVLFEHNFTGTLQNYSASGNSSNEYFYNYGPLAAGSYVWRSYATDAVGHVAATPRWSYVINKATSICNLTINPPSPQTYPVQVNASCTCTNPEAQATLWRNGINVTNENNQFVELAAGSYNYVCNVSETENYTAATNSTTYIINKATTILNITAQPSWTITYGTQTNVSCSANNAEVTPRLYINSSEVGIPYATVHAAGSYNYTCNASATQNWTSASVSQILQVAKASSAVNLTLNGIDGNITVEAGSSVTMNATLLAGEAALELYEDGSLLNQGSSPLTHQKIYTAAGLYNITALHPGSQNYTASSDTHFIAVQDTIAPMIVSTIITPYDPYIGSNVSLNASATDNGELDGIFANITLPNGTQLTLELPTDYAVQLVGRHNITFWANDSAGNVGFAEDYFIAGSTLLNVTFNVVDHNFSGIEANLTIFFAGTNDQVDALLFNGAAYDNGTNILYDLHYEVLDGNAIVRLNSVNLSVDSNGTLGIDKLNMSGFLVVYGIYSTYSIASAELDLSYGSTPYTNEDYLSVYKCAAWNFTTRSCAGTWELIAALPDKAADRFSFTVPSLSAFAIKQESYCGDGVCDPDEDCESCPEDCGVCKEEVRRRRRSCISEWNCTAWGPCTPEGLQYRTCIDIRNCRIPFKKPPEVRECTYVPSCNNGIKDIDETDVDCGGVCPPCPDGKRCITDDDCIGKCDPIKKICYTPKIKPEISMPKTFRSIQAFTRFVYNIFKISKDILIKAPINLIKGLSTIIIKNKFLSAYTIVITMILIIVLQIGKIKQKRLQKKIERYLKKLREEGKL